MSDAVTRLHTALADRYAIERELGQGGMATVYLAADLKHERKVAIKVLRPELAAVLGAERFVQEIKTTAALSHPHILPLFDSGEADSFVYYVMPFVAGESLRDRLDRDGRLGIEESLSIGRGIAAALEHAHRQQIVHRDIKPENVMLSDGLPVVADFGIARAAAIAGEERLTRTGVSIGTPAYMSPEQAFGESEIDGRSDVYALGCVLYEMLTGDLPYSGPTVQAIITRSLTEPIPSVRKLREEVPATVDAAIRRALEKAPADRYGSAAEFGQALADALAALAGGDAVLSGTFPPSASIDGVGRTRLVGRDRERAQLDRMLRQAAAGRGALVLLGGEPGVGKTRLATELLEDGRERGMLALTGHAYEDRTVPFVTTAELLEDMARLVDPPSLRPLLGDGASELSRLLPELRTLFPDIPVPADLPPEQQQRVLFRSVLEFLQRAGARSPIVMLLDDVHWADESSLMLLEYMAQRINELRVLMIGTYRDAETDMGPAFAKTLANLVRQRLAERLAIQCFDRRAVADLLAARGGSEPPADLVDIIYDGTEGNAFFVEEVYRHLSEEGLLLDEEGRWRADLDAGALDVPEGVRLVTGRRLERLAESTRKVLTTAAAIGMRFDLGVLESATGDADQALDGVEEAEAAQLILPAAGPRDTRYEFGHALVRQTLLDGLSVPRRQRLHLGIADAMERVLGDRAEEHAADIAHQLEEAGPRVAADRTRRFLALAGDRALGAAAPEEALGFFEKALALDSGSTPTERARILFQRGVAQRTLGRWDDAAAEWEKALPVLESAGEVDLVTRICRDLAFKQIWENQTAAAKETVARGLGAAGDTATAGRCRLLSILGYAHSLATEFDEAEEANDLAMALARQLGDEQLLGGEVLLTRHYLYQHSLRPRRMAETVEQAIEISRRSGRPWDLSNALGAAELAWLLQGRYDEMEKHDEEIRVLADREGDFGSQFHHLLCRGFSEFARGRLAPSVTLFEECVELCREVGFPWISVSRAIQGTVEFFRGDWPKAAASHDEALATPVSGTWQGFEAAHHVHALAYTAPDRAASSFEELRAGLPGAGSTHSAGAWTRAGGLVEAAAMLGKRAECAELYPLMRSWRDEGGVVFFVFGLTEKLAGISAAAGERWDDAERHFQEALREAEQLPHVPEQPEVRRWYARMLLDRDGSGDRKRAHALLAEARAGYDEIGMPKHLEMVDAILA